MIRALKNRKQRTSNLPISMGRVLRTAFGVAGFALWGWGFVAVVMGLYIGLKCLKGILSCLLTLLIITLFIALLIALSNHFRQTIQNYLEQRAQTDELFPLCSPSRTRTLTTACSPEQLYRD